MNNDWPKYFKPNKCKKCGLADTTTTYHDGKFPECDRDCPGHRILGPEPHMLRHCRNCGYEWCETPLDVSQLQQPPRAVAERDAVGAKGGE